MEREFEISTRTILWVVGTVAAAAAAYHFLQKRREAESAKKAQGEGSAQSNNLIHFPAAGAR